MSGATRDAIAKASAEARERLLALDRDRAEHLRSLYVQLVDLLERELLWRADAEGKLRLEMLRDFMSKASGLLEQLRQQQRDLLAETLLDAAAAGAAVWADGAAVSMLATTAARFVEAFIGLDGLKLSDRLWRIENGARQAIAETLRRNVLLGRDASRAAAEFLARAEAIPPDVRAALGLDRAEKLGGAVREALMTGRGNAYSNALRVFRTELNRAHTEAYQAGAGAHPDVVGMKFNLSPNHPRTDICDLYYHANLHGLGPGIYPVGRAPWPAHPNTMSYLTAVFREEVGDGARAGKQDRLEWLRGQPPGRQDRMLGAAKAAALRAGALQDADIDKPWKALKEGYERRGYTFD